jgi:uncharacterized membrane protein
MHLIGGFWLTLFILWISARFGHIDSIVKYKSKAFFVAIISAIIIGIVWEIIELLGGITSIKDVGYLKDSGFYILTTVIGGFFAYLYFIKRRSCKLGVDCELMTDKKL